MKTLQNILHVLSGARVTGSPEVEITGITADSSKAAKGSVFVAVKGTRVDGHDFIPAAIAAGASAVVCSTMPAEASGNVVWVQVEDTSIALPLLAAAFHDFPSRKLFMVGVTGTNGKTTSVTLLHNLFTGLGHKSGMLSTVENKIGEKILPATHTTPDPVSLQALLAQMVEEGCTHCFMEVSSHALVQHRTLGISYAVALFSNISHDHLDYHGTFDNYIAAKKLLFDGLEAGAKALVNADDKRGRIMLQNCKAEKYAFSLKSLGDFKAKIITNTVHGLELDMDGTPVWFKLTGEFNAYNLLGVYAVALLAGLDKEEVLMKLSGLEPPKGRFQTVYSKGGVTGIVDYAHTPDALQNVLNTVNELLKPGASVLTVVGCGGNRDKTKRPEMAKIAAKNSGKTVLTSDNPRDEEPAVILEEMLAGVAFADRQKVLVIADRKEAIRTACMLAMPGDVILVAGKGHENYQEIKGVKHPFEDMPILTQSLKELNK